MKYERKTFFRTSSNIYIYISKHAPFAQTQDGALADAEQAAIDALNDAEETLVLAKKVYYSTLPTTSAPASGGAVCVCV